MQEKDLHSEVDDIIVRGIIEHGKKIEQMKKWQRGGHKSVARRLLYAALTAAAIFILGIVITPSPKKAPPAYNRDVPNEFPFIVEEEEREGNGSSMLSIVIESGLREFGMERLSLVGSNADSLMNHLDLFVDDDYDAEWAKILLLAKVNRKEECRELLKEFIKKEGSHKDQAIRLNELIE